MKQLPDTRFALDHLTAIETTPRALAETAAAAGYDRICTFVRSIDGLGGPAFNLTTDAAEMKAVRTSLASLGLSIDVAYPFTLSDRTKPGDFEADLECAATLGARYVNLLCFIRDAGRLAEETASFCARARNYGLRVTIEMVPASTIRTLPQAARLLTELCPGPDVGINLDVLHLYRSGATPADVFPYRDKISYLQICDGPLEAPIETRHAEASHQRCLPGRGDFALAHLMRLLEGVPVSVEIPDEAGRTAGLDAVTRARAAFLAARSISP